MIARSFALGRLVRGHTLAIGFVLAMAPLATLLTLQVIWLKDLDRASRVAQQAKLRTCLDAIGNEVGHFYRSTSERLLNVPPELFANGKVDGIAAYWKARPRDGVRGLFAIDYTQSATGNYYTYVPDREAMVPTAASDESLAILLAAMPWQRWAAQGPPRDETMALHVNEQDPDHRIILKPVSDEGHRIVGVVGLLVDADYVREELIHRIIEATVPTFFWGEEQPSIHVSDGRGRPVLGAPAEAALGLSPAFVLRDWTVSAVQVNPAPRWVNGSLGYNLTLGFAVAVVMVAGILLALLGARRTMRLSEMKSDFVSNVSHELRTPIASIRLFAELMKRGRVTTPEKVIEYGSYIEAESRRLSRLIDNILDFSRIESRQKEYRCEQMPVLDVVERVLDAFEVRIQQAGLRLKRRLPEPPGPMAKLDADAVGQALHNLLDNAAKYSKDHGEEITVLLDEQDEHVVISVQDEGIGIAKTDQAKVFERFHRVSTGLVHDVKGSGLGLAIVEHTARAHGGYVTVQSELDRGSTFSLWIPTCKENWDGENPHHRG